MKIAVYTIETVKPQPGSDEYFDIIEILNLPSLKYGTADFIGKFSHWITKGDFKKMKKVWARYYDRTAEVWREGALLLKEEKKLFVEYAGNL